MIDGPLVLNLLALGMLAAAWVLAAKVEKHPEIETGARSHDLKVVRGGRHS